MTEDHQEQLAVLQNEMRHLKEDVADVKNNQKELINALNKYKGAVGLLLVLITAISAASTLIFQYVKLKAGS